MADVILAERPLSYKDFILSKSHSGGDHGFKPISLPSCLFDFQSAMVEWALRKGRAALFEDCGRFIPAHAGNSGAAADPPTPPPVHPRARGEQ